jgi:hypothetical protein
VSWSQPFQRLRKKGEVGPLDDLLLAAVDGSELDHRRGLGAAASAVVVDAEAPGDHRHPRIEPALAAQRRQCPEGAGEGLLRDLFRLEAVTDPLQAEPLQAAEIPAVQQVERAGIALLKAFHERAIPLQIHVVYTKRQSSLPELVMP